MKKEITVSAKSVEDAVAKAVAELGAHSADKIEYTVLCFEICRISALKHRRISTRN